jgi:hypothetical protein
VDLLQQSPLLVVEIELVTLFIQSIDALEERRV